MYMQQVTVHELKKYWSAIDKGEDGNVWHSSLALAGAPRPERTCEDTTVNAARLNDEIKRYESELAGILSRFTHSRDSVDIRREDDSLFRQYVRELIDLFNDLGEKKYSRQIAAEFDQGTSNFLGSPSYQSVDNILGIVRAARTRFERDPGLLIGSGTGSSPRSGKVFIVHGHAGTEQAVARFLGRLGLEAVILHERPNQGRTIVEKFEAHSDVGFAVVLLTPDDVGRTKDGELRPRARQNVVLELGYFIGKLGRSHVCALKQGDIELPSDILGVLWESLDDHGGWQLKLAKELQAAGYEVDLNKVTRG
jgi:predicted nucleotide-binding protein